MTNEKRKETIKDYIARHIKQFREEADMSQADLGEVLGKSNSNISDIERGRLDINAADLGLIAEALGKPVSYFYPFKTVKVSSPDDLRGVEQRMVAAMREIPYTELEELMVQHVEHTAKWASQDEFQRIVQELMRAGKVILEKD